MLTPDRARAVSPWTWKPYRAGRFIRKRGPRGGGPPSAHDPPTQRQRKLLQQSSELMTQHPPPPSVVVAGDGLIHSASELHSLHCSLGTCVLCTLQYTSENPPGTYVSVLHRRCPDHRCKIPIGNPPNFDFWLGFTKGSLIGNPPNI